MNARFLVQCCCYEAAHKPLMFGSAKEKSARSAMPLLKWRVGGIWTCTDGASEKKEAAQAGGKTAVTELPTRFRLWRPQLPDR